MVKIEGKILDELTQLRDELYNNLPTGKLDAFELIKVVKKHIEELDSLIGYYEAVSKGAVKG